jgi:hypothetical protein
VNPTTRYTRFTIRRLEFSPLLFEISSCPIHYVFTNIGCKQNSIILKVRFNVPPYVATIFSSVVSYQISSSHLHFLNPHSPTPSTSTLSNGFGAILHLDISTLTRLSTKPLAPTTHCNPTCDPPSVVEPLIHGLHINWTKIFLGKIIVSVRPLQPHIAKSIQHPHLKGWGKNKNY